MASGHVGWDEYAPFYDWENSRTVGRQDLSFWRRIVGHVDGPVLELGCGTGRLSLPLGRVVRHRLVGIDRSAPMLAGARARLRRTPARVSLVRGDIRTLPFRAGTSFHLVMAPYGIVQSLTRESDLVATLKAVRAVLAPDGLFGLDLVPDLSSWEEYRNRVRLRGRRPGSRAHVTLIESVRQDRRRRLTIFDQSFVELRGGRRRRRRFSLTFRTLSVPQMRRRLEAAGFRVEAVLGDYHGAPWDPRADVWLMLARPR